MRRHRLAVVAAAALAVAGCKDMGLRDRNLSLEEARSREPTPLVQQATYGTGQRAAQQSITLDGETWSPSGELLTIPQRLLRPVAGGGGFTLYSLQTDEPPFDALYVQRAPGQWAVYRPVY